MAALCCLVLSFVVLGFGQDLSPSVAGEGQNVQAPSNTVDCTTNPTDPGCRMGAGATGSRAAGVPQVTTPSIVVDESSTSGFGQKLERSPQVPQPQQAATPTEFQNFVAGSVGVILPIYGDKLFVNSPTTFAPVEQVPVPSDYVIGPGDQLLIRAWGQVNIQERTIVDRSGQIFIPKVGTITLAGVKYANLDDYLKREMGRVFRNFELSTSLTQLRSVEIFVLGNARRPGRYTISSLSTLVNALFASGGPSSTGSMRNIELKREGKTIIVFDVYDLLVFGDKSKDVPLLPGDVIYIPPVGPQIAIAGSINVPAIYEIKNEDLGGAIRLAGGLTSIADGEQVTIERIEHRTSRKVDTISLDSRGLSTKLQDGDFVRLTSIVPRFDNAVTLRGNVANPGRFPWKQGNEDQ